MSEMSCVDIWNGPAFRAALTDFVTAAVGPPRRLEPARVRPWSTVWRVEADGGTYWAKDNCPGQRHEATLLRRLQELAPGRVVPLTAADPGAGLLLTPDRGPTLQEQGPVDAATWCRVVSAHAGLQRTTAPFLDSLGLTRVGVADAVADVERLVATLRAFPDGDPRRLTDDQARTVEAVVPDVALWAEQVAALGLPVVLDHNDLHPGNVFDVGGRLELFDLGDAVATHPLAALRIPLASAVEDGLAPAAARRIVEVVVEAWSDLAPARDLRAAVPAALQLGVLGRTESWLRCVADMTGEALETFGGSAAAWLTRLAEEPSHGSVPRARRRGGHAAGPRRLS